MLFFGNASWILNQLIRVHFSISNIVVVGYLGGLFRQEEVQYGMEEEVASRVIVKDQLQGSQGDFLVDFHFCKQNRQQDCHFF